MEDWHPEDIKAAVRKRRATLAKLARDAGMGGSALRIALALPRAEGERVIADFLGVHPMTIWPSRYQADGTRKRPQPRRNYRADARLANAA